MEVLLVDYSRGRHLNILKAMGQAKNKFGKAMDNGSDDANISEKDAARIRKFALGKKHFSLLEYVWVMIRYSGISRVCFDQFRTHRHLSFTAKSGREFIPESIIIPPGRSNRVQLRYLTAWYHSLNDYHWLIANGESVEDARRVLPIGQEIECVVSGNARAWYEVIQKRLCRNAQAEIRELAMKTKDVLASILPVVFSDVSCVGCEDNCGEREENGKK